MKKDENATKRTFAMSVVNTGKGVITIWALLGIWSVAALTSLPGLAVSPILEKLSVVVYPPFTPKLKPAKADREEHKAISSRKIFIVFFILVGLSVCVLYSTFVLYIFQI